MKTAAIEKALVELDVEPTYSNWIIKMLENIIFISEMGDNRFKRRATRVIPQGGVIFSHVWLIVINKPKDLAKKE